MDPKELLNTRWSLLNARTQFLDGRKGPSALCPPGRSRLSIGAHNLAGPVVILSRRFPLLHNIKGRCQAAMFINVRFHRPDIFWRYLCLRGLVSDLHRQ